MLQLAAQFVTPEVACLAPAASGNSWYPERFMAPLERNQPSLNYALEAYHTYVIGLQRRGVPLRRIILVGFSQGACLTAEYAVRHAAPYGGVILFTGGLIGPDGTRWEYPGTFDGTPVFIGGAEQDGWVPLERMRTTADVFRRMGAHVTTCFYPGNSHEVHEEEIVAARTIVEAVIAEAN